MGSLLYQLPIVGSLLARKPQQKPMSASGLDLPPVAVLDIENATEKDPRTLKHLLRANHSSYSLYTVCSDDSDGSADPATVAAAHNTTAPLLTSAFLLGAHHAQLTALYETATAATTTSTMNASGRQLCGWRPSPSEVTLADWSMARGRRTFQRALVDFLEDQVAMRYSFDWRRAVQALLFNGGPDQVGHEENDGSEPLAACLIGAFGQPLIHLALALELDNRETAIEALALAVLDTPSQLAERVALLTLAAPSTVAAAEANALPQPSTLTSHNPTDILTNVAVAAAAVAADVSSEYGKGEDRREPRSAVARHSLKDDVDFLSLLCDQLVMEHWQAWKMDVEDKGDLSGAISNTDDGYTTTPRPRQQQQRKLSRLARQVRQAQDAAVAMLADTNSKPADARVVVPKVTGVTTTATTSTTARPLTKTEDATTDTTNADRPYRRYYSFCLAQVLITSQALGTVVALAPDRWRRPLLRQWWLLAVALCAAAGTRKKKESQARVKESDEKESEIQAKHRKNWKYVVHEALSGPWAHDAQFVQVVRSLRQMERTWEGETLDKAAAEVTENEVIGASSSKYLRAAVSFVDGFSGWC